MVSISPPLSKEEVAFRINREWQRKKHAVATPESPYGLRTIARHLAHRYDVPQGIDATTAVKSRLRQLQRYVNATHMPSADYLVKLAGEFGCKPDALGVLEESDDPPSVEPDAARVMDRDLLAEVRALKRNVARLERRMVLAK